jgi:DNA-binding transcriptional ArsR family regulator
MRDLDKALADIVAIRSQIAAGTAFRGYGPATMAATGAVALVTAILQFWLLGDPTSEPLGFFFGWFVAATLSGLMIWIEMRARSRRHHSGLADAMIHQAVEQFLPAGVAGVLLAVVMWKFAAETLWLLPGLWQILVSLGIFASVRSLPRSVAFAGAWYFISGFAVVLLASRTHMLSPWTMGLPFVIGQSVMAAILETMMTKTDSAPFSYEGLDRVIHEKARLGLLTSLMAHPKGLAFADLKQLCGLTDGNLSRHLAVLQEAGLVDVTKGYEGNRPHTTCRLTKTGRRRFLDYLAVLERLVRDAAKAAGREAPPLGRLGILPT